MNLRWRCSSRSMRARSYSLSGSSAEKASSVAGTLSVCSATSTARQLVMLPASTMPKRSRMRPRGGAIMRALMRFSSAIVV